MSFEITEAFNRQYTSNLQMLLQQRGSKLRDCVANGSYGGKSAKVVEQIGAVTPAQRTTRHGDTQYINTPHDGRWVFPTAYNLADLIDDIDKLQTLIVPTSAYAVNMAYGHGRAMDDAIITALFGTAKTGENGSTNTAFDTANQQIAVGTTGLTLDKLIQAKEILMSNEVDFDFEEVYVGYTSRQLRDLLGETELTSSDYAQVKALVEGKVDRFMGFTFKNIERLGVDGSSNRRIPIWCKSGMHLGMWQDISSKIEPLATKNYSVQVYTSSMFGATRVEEGKVVEVLCSEA